MRGRGRRSAGRVCLAATAVCAVLAVAAPARAQEEGSSLVPDIFRGAATSFVASVEADREALLPIDDLFRFVALDGTSIYETDLQTARSSLLFPGNGLILGPNLACGTFGGQFPPEFGPLLDACLQYEYPLSVTADASEQSRATEGSTALGAPTDPVSVVAVASRATASPEGSATYAAMEALRILGLPAFGPVRLLPTEELDLDSSILTIDSATSRTDQRIEAGVLTVDAESILNGVKLIGGLIQIGSIRSLSQITDDAAGGRTSESSLEVSGVTVAGAPAQLTEDGLVVGDPSGSTGPLDQQLQNALNQVLEAMQIEITALDTEQTLDDGTGQAVASAGGILVEVAADAQDLPILPGPTGDLDPNGTYVGSFQLGNTAAAGGATNFEIEDFPIADTPVDVGGDVPFDAGGSVLDTGAALDTDPTPGADPAAGPEQAAPRAQELVRTLTDPFGGRLAFVYLTFMFAVLSMALMPKLTMPARFAGPGS